MFYSCSQTDVPTVQGQSNGAGQEVQIHPPDGHRLRGRLSLQVPQRQVDGGGQGGPRDAEAAVHPPGLAIHRGAVDAEDGVVPQAEADQQHLRQTRICKYPPCKSNLPASHAHYTNISVLSVIYVFFFFFGML